MGVWDLACYKCGKLHPRSTAVCSRCWVGIDYCKMNVELSLIEGQDPKSRAERKTCALQHYGREIHQNPVNVKKNMARSKTPGSPV